MALTELTPLSQNGKKDQMEPFSLNKNSIYDVYREIRTVYTPVI